MFLPHDELAAISVSYRRITAPLKTICYVEYRLGSRETLAWGRGEGNGMGEDGWGGGRGGGGWCVEVGYSRFYTLRRACTN